MGIFTGPRASLLLKKENDKRKTLVMIVAYDVLSS